MSWDEATQVRRARAGDERAFTAIVGRYKNTVYRLCCRYVGLEEAEDMAQETFLRAFVHRERVDPRRPLLPWLLTIARRLCIDHLRKKAPHPDAERAAHLADHSPSVEQSFARKEQLQKLSKALLELPEGPREAVALYHFEALSYQEIASTLDVPVGTVMTWLHRGRARLRAVLQQPASLVAQAAACGTNRCGGKL